jgi:hypothetical protein
MSEESDAVEAKRQSILESRRRALTGQAAPEPKPEHKEEPASERRGKRKSKLLPWLLGLVLVAGLGVGAYFGVQLYRASTPLGKVKAKLLAAEFCLPNQRDQRFDEVDGADPNAPQLVIGLLNDTSLAADGSNHSQTPVRELANRYLLRLAKRRNQAPPPVANDIEVAIRSGRTPSGEQWAQLQNAWKNVVK